MAESPFTQSFRDSKYLWVMTAPDNIISIFDECRYDRSDIDMVSPGMRKYILGLLKEEGFQQRSGNVFKHKENDIECIIPKFHALGSSPFDITRYTHKREQDYYILTPTQTACLMIDAYDFEHALDAISALIAEQPINIFKLMDYLENTDKHQAFLKVITTLRDCQKIAIQQESLKLRKSLG